MLKVRIRSSNEEAGPFLCECSVSELDDLRQMIRRDRCYLDSEDASFSTTDGQFVVEDGVAYYDLIVEVPE